MSYTPAPTPATYANGVPLDPATLSTIAQATLMLGLLSTVPYFPGGSTVQEQTTENGAPDGNAIDYNGETRRLLNIVQVGGTTLNVGDLLDKMGGWGSAGAFTCSGPGSPYSPIWVPAKAVAPVNPIVVPVSPGPNYVWTEVGPGFWTWELPSTGTIASPSGPATLTLDQAAIITRLGAWLTKVGG